MSRGMAVGAAGARRSPCDDDLARVMK